MHQALFHCIFMFSLARLCFVLISFTYACLLCISFHVLARTSYHRSIVCFATWRHLRFRLTGHKSRLASAASQPARQQNPARPMTSATCDDVTRVVKTATVCVERCRHCPASMSLRSFLMHKKGWKMLSSDPAKGVESSRVLICCCYWFYCPRLW